MEMIFPRLLLLLVVVWLLALVPRRWGPTTRYCFCCCCDLDWKVTKGLMTMGKTFIAADTNYSMTPKDKIPHLIFDIATTSSSSPPLHHSYPAATNDRQIRELR